MGYLGPTVTEARKNKRRERTDGDRRRCKRGRLEDGRWIAGCRKAETETEMKMRLL